MPDTPLRQQLRESLATNEVLRAENEQLREKVTALSDQVAALKAELDQLLQAAV